MAQKYVPVALRRRVRERAGGCCEYCRIPERLTFALHWVDHIVAEKHGGRTEEAKPGADEARDCTFVFPLPVSIASVKNCGQGHQRATSEMARATSRSSAGALGPARAARTGVT